MIFDYSLAGLVTAGLLVGGVIIPFIGIKAITWSFRPCNLSGDPRSRRAHAHHWTHLSTGDDGYCSSHVPPSGQRQHD
jgi:hypothetical protein